VAGAWGPSLLVPLEAALTTIIIITSIPPLSLRNRPIGQEEEEEGGELREEEEGGGRRCSLSRR